MKKFLILTLLTLTLGFTTACGGNQSVQGYEAEQGYMQPDHSDTYYHVFFWAQPTYHVYVAPYGYPRTYRPWYGSDIYRTERRTTIINNYNVTHTAPTPVSRPAVTPTPAAPPTARSTGGFAASAPAAPKAPAQTRSSGGFSGGVTPVRPSAPSSSPRSSGGFSSSRSSGGFSRRK